MCLHLAIDYPHLVLHDDEYRQTQFIIMNNGLGFRCGYVRVPAGHPWHGEMNIDADVHGGITFAAPDRQCDQPGDDDSWWIGFDTAHAGDAPDPLLPHDSDRHSKILFESMHTDGVVRGQYYVEEECRRLINQLWDRWSEHGRTIDN